MKNLGTYLTLLMAVVIVTMKRYTSEPSIRDRIKFKMPAKTIEKKLRTMNYLMDKVPPIKDQMINYFFDSQGNFYINSRKMGPIGSFDLDTASLADGFTADERIKFVRTVIFLKNNFISKVYKDEACGCYLYDYRSLEDEEFNPSRLIFLKDSSKNYETLYSLRTNLDVKGDLVLIGKK
ncbi:hypothetical protein [Spirosoma aerophilum]